MRRARRRHAPATARACSVTGRAGRLGRLHAAAAQGCRAREVGVTSVRWVSYPAPARAARRCPRGAPLCAAARRTWRRQLLTTAGARQLPRGGRRALPRRRRAGRRRCETRQHDRGVEPRGGHVGALGRERAQRRLAGGRGGGGARLAQEGAREHVAASFSCVRDVCTRVKVNAWGACTPPDDANVGGRGCKHWRTPQQRQRKGTRGCCRRFCGRRFVFDGTVGASESEGSIALAPPPLSPLTRRPPSATRAPAAQSS